MRDADKHKIAVKLAKAKIRSFVHNLKNKPCLDCNIQYPYYVMQFDHARGTKEFQLSSARGLNKSKERILLEVAKCDVVCANCHMIRTWSRKNSVA